MYYFIIILSSGFCSDNFDSIRVVEFLNYDFFNNFFQFSPSSFKFILLIGL